VGGDITCMPLDMAGNTAAVAVPLSVILFNAKGRLLANSRTKIDRSKKPATLCLVMEGVRLSQLVHSLHG
jgi:hypothetical protein